MNNIPSGDNYGGAGRDDPHIRFCERPMNLFMGLLDVCAAIYRRLMEQESWDSSICTKRRRPLKNDLREAMQRLELEELVVRQPNGRLKVASISKQEVQEIFAVRSLLEGIIARQAAHNADEKDIHNLGNIMGMIQRSAEMDDEEDIIYHGSEFHSYLYDLSGNKTAVKILNMLNDHIHRYRRLVPLKNKGRHGKTIEEHARVLKCIEEKDEDGADLAMREHILSSLATVVERIEDYEKERAVQLDL